MGSDCGANMAKSSDSYEELWRRCAGPLVHLPRIGERVFYFPQGHLQQEAILNNNKAKEMLPTYDLPSRILCRVIHINLKAAETNQVYAQITLLPEYSQDDVNQLDPLSLEDTTQIIKSTYKLLTPTDISSKLHVPQQDAIDCFPPLDMTQDTPSQELVAKDIHGILWHFKHVFSGKPKRHVLTKGWKRFVSQNRLVSGDSVIFVRGENGELRIGSRHLSVQRRHAPAGESADLVTTKVLEIACHAICTGTLFTVFYRPSLGSSEFIVGLNRYVENAKKLWSIGKKFSMRFEGEDHLQRLYNGSIVGVGDVSPSWKDSKWQCLKVKWDEPATIIRPERVSPWEIDDAIVLNEEQRYVQSNKRLGKRSKAKKTRQPSCYNSARDGNTMNFPDYPNEQNLCFQLAVQPSQQQSTQNTSQVPCLGWAPSQQYWIGNTGQPDWTAVQTLSQQGYQRQAHNIPVAPVLSIEDSWLQYMLNHIDQLDEHVSANMQLNDIGQIFANAETSQSMIRCNHIPTISPTIHFSELQEGLAIELPSRVSINSEESVQRETKKRKTSVQDAESGICKEQIFDDRQVKCRIEPSQCAAVSNSNETLYSSASEGEPSPELCNHDSAPVKASANASGRPFTYRARDLFFSFLHQLKNYVAK